jgi:hypothetical protein
MSLRWSDVIPKTILASTVGAGLSWLAPVALAGFVVISGLSCSLFEKRVEMIPGYEMRLPYGYSAVESGASSYLGQAAAAVPGLQMKAYDITPKKQNGSLQLVVVVGPAGPVPGMSLSAAMAAAGVKFGSPTLTRAIPSEVCQFNAEGYRSPMTNATTIMATCPTATHMWFLGLDYPGDCDDKCQAFLDKLFGRTKAKK